MGEPNSSESNESGIKSFIGYDLLYPPNIKKDILNGRKWDIYELAKKGMILVFDILQPKGVCTPETLAEIPKMFITPFGGVIIIDMDEIIATLKKRCEFIRETGIFDDFPLWLFSNVLFLSDLFDENVKEIENEGLRAGHNLMGCYTFYMKNPDIEKLGYEHVCMFLSTHKALLKFPQSLRELNRGRLKKLFLSQNNIAKKRKTHITNSLRHEVFKRDKYKCCECGMGKNETSLHIDHVIPVSRGGSDELDNLQTLCEACNFSKSNRIFLVKEEGARE